MTTKEEKLIGILALVFLVAGIVLTLMTGDAVFSECHVNTGC